MTITETQQEYLYFEGRPREYRFNGQNGQFNLYGDRILTEKSGRLLTKFSLQPIAYRIFEDCLFGRSLRELWAELFFVDDDKCVANILFNGESAIAILAVLESIPRSRTLCDLVITVYPKYVQGKGVTSKGYPNKGHYTAEFEYEAAEDGLVNEMRELSQSIRIYRSETLTVSAQHKAASPGYYIDKTNAPQ